MFHLVAMAASAGGLSALTTVLERLPSDFPLPLAVVQHIDPAHASHVAEILNRRTRLAVKEAADHEVMTPGVVYVAPPGSHMLVSNGGAIELTHGKLVHFVRPAADCLFESAAQRYGPVIGVVLTGTGMDGAQGARAIKVGGGIMIAQDEASSAFFGMPSAAILTGAVDFVLPLNAIAPALLDLVGVSQS